MEFATCGKCAYIARTKQGLVCLADASNIHSVGQNEAPCGRFIKKRSLRQVVKPYVEPDFSEEDASYIEDICSEVIDDAKQNTQSQQEFDWESREADRAKREMEAEEKNDKLALLRLIGIPSQIKLGPVSKDYKHTEAILESRAQTPQQMEIQERKDEREDSTKAENDNRPSAFHLFLQRILKA